MIVWESWLPEGIDVIYFKKNAEKFRWHWLRPLVLILSDFSAIFLVCAVFNGLFLLTLNVKLISWSVAITGCLFFIFAAELSRLYHESLFVPGLLPPPHEELRRIFYIIMGLLVIRLFYFQEFPWIFANIKNADGWSVWLKVFLVFGIFPFVFFSVIFFRWLARALMFQHDIGIFPVVILGAGKTGKIVAGVLNKSKHYGLKPVGFFDDDPQKRGEVINGSPVIGSLDDYYEKNEKKPSYWKFVPFLCLPLPALQNWGRRIFLLHKRAYVASSENFFPTSGANIYDLHGVTVLGLKNNLNIKYNLHVQRLLNLLISSLALVVFFIPMLIIALLVRLTSEGPILFFATRLGQGGKEITIPKFRTMHKDAEERLKELFERSPEIRREWEANFKLKNDSRITPLGKFLRKTSLDELPQLFSVLKGDLNLVGPRPIVADEIKFFGEGYDFISRVKPGLTGMWQVSGRSETTYDERVFLETYYIRNWSIWLDLYILMKTVLEVILCRGAY